MSYFFKLIATQLAGCFANTPLFLLHIGFPYSISQYLGYENGKNCKTSPILKTKIEIWVLLYHTWMLEFNSI